MEGAQLPSGATMPTLGLGTWQLTDDTAGTVATALELGYRMIDTSGDYGTQAGVGEGIRTSGLERDEIFLVTKVEEDEDAYEATVKNLDEIGVERADLMLLHRPPEQGGGEDLWEGLIRAKKDGLTREIGVSNYSIELVDALVDATGEVPAINQVEWTPFGWSPELLEHHTDAGIVIQAYSPLTRGKRLDDGTVAEIARDCDRTPGQVLIRWGIQLGVVPLPKANKPEHLEENLGALRFELSEDQMRRLSDLNEEWSALGDELQYL